MLGGRRTGMTAGLLAAGVMLVSACGGSSEADPPVALESPAASPAPLDAQTCASVQGLLGHLGAATTQWSVTAHPFDPAVLKQIRQTSTDLRKQTATAQQPVVRLAIVLNADAFYDLSAAMTLKSHSRFDKSLLATRRAFNELKQACNWA